MLNNFFQLKSEALMRFDKTADFISHFDNSNSLKHADLIPDAAIEERGFKRIDLENVRLSKLTFRRVTFTGCVFRDCLFVGTVFEDCEFHNCRFENCNTHKVTLKDVYIDPRSFSLHPSYRRTASNIGVYLFQELYRNASATYQSYFAAFADIERRRWRRYQLRYDLRERQAPLVQTWARILSDLVFDKVAKYGYGPLRFFLLSLVAFVVVAVVGQVLWPAMAVAREGHVVSAASFADVLYYCMLLMTTLGFSDLMPTTGLGKAFAVACAFLGIAWMGLFTAILVRRVIR